MYGSKHKSNVALFPLCDTRGVLIKALLETGDVNGTRGDALVFAWRLELPSAMDVAKAANALLLVAMSVPRIKWNRYQLLIIRELMVLAGWQGDVPGHTRVGIASNRTKPLLSSKSNVEFKSKLELIAEKSRRPAKKRDGKSGAKSGKESKHWWHLVGKDEANEIVDQVRSQRKAREERASREPDPKP